MSILLDFYAGDAKEIGKAWDADDFDRMKDPRIVLGHADFSLHLEDITFMFFSQCASRLAGGGPDSLESSLSRNVGGDAENTSADVVSPEWVKMIASLDDEKLGWLGWEWIETMKREYASVRDTNGYSLTPDLWKALLDLRSLCRTSIQNGCEVVFIWSL
jgi:hypothetical protein